MLRRMPGSLYSLATWPTSETNHILDNCVHEQVRQAMLHRNEKKREAHTRRPLAPQPVQHSGDEPRIEAKVRPYQLSCCPCCKVVVNNIQKHANMPSTSFYHLYHHVYVHPTPSCCRLRHHPNATPPDKMQSLHQQRCQRGL
jgi:hypothetical protein